jgi:RNA polymerase sigma-70 factor (ECF subfamily)
MLWRIAGAYAAAADREDLLQEMLLVIWQKLPGFAGRSKLSTWAWQVALYTALNWSRKHQRQPATEDVAQLQETVVAPTAGPQERLEVVLCALRQQSASDRALLTMALEEMPRLEMAAVLGISESAVHVRLHRARQRLQETLNQMES